MRLVACLTLCCALLAWGCGRDEPILIGYSGPLTGGRADLGVQGRNGATLAVEDVNARGGVAGRPLALVACDDGATPESAVEADAQLIKAGVAAIVGHMTSAQTLAALPQAAAAGVVMLSPTTTAPELSGKTDLFFRVLPDNLATAQTLARYAARHGRGPACLLGDTDNLPYVQSFLDAFDQAYAEAGGQVACRRMYSSREGIDWAALLDAATQNGVGAVVAAASAKDVAALARAMDAAGARLPILCPAWPYTREILTMGGRSVDGIVFAASYTEDNPRPRFQDFMRRYQERFGWPANFAAVSAYEAVEVLAAALGRTGGRTAGLPEALLALGQQEGLMGPFAFDAYGDVHRQTFLVTIRDGRFSALEGD
ncbi:ABC transporter substrate-binding protein [Solidesulfovibrio carbinolicus]|uniref:Amino acid ABC transporter substrate-binding protein n=1 Tax=Solidesulfovibrio carbinolicus TaxID=296842 RepID=A0A4P6HFC0_9BACT|nr:ABC transporter substrate-binding protein [Solidesulfovibrio carbinolicus]QAZ65793.1 amino acid ABC transporter substrate-binding protein [Solidesulfovibrio carbinolicus]